VRLTVLGKSPAWPDAGGACSGYLVEAGGFHLLIDCGNGVMGKMRERIDYLELDAVVISHIHADHVLDLAPLAYGLTLSPRQDVDDSEGAPVAAPVRPLLHLPPGGTERMRRLVGSWGSDDLIDRAFVIAEYAAGEAISIGPLTVVPTEVPHFTKTFALTVGDGNGRFTFSADCAPSEALIEAARGSSLLLAEATFSGDQAPEDSGHLTPEQAGGAAAAASVERLVLTHISDEYDAEAAVTRAAEEFAGPIDLAAEGTTYEI
jgi:ribonuclease BN (tRNA processing enzyme)